MAHRLELHDELKELLGTNNCFFQPPESLKLNYPCYVYHLIDTNLFHANDTIYHRTNKYGLTYITLDPDDPLIEETEDHFKMCKFVRFYAEQGLNHYYYYLYY